MAERENKEIGQCQCADSAPPVYDQKNQSDEQRSPDQKIVQHVAPGPVVIPQNSSDIRVPSPAARDAKHRCKPMRIGVSATDDATMQARGKALAFG